jgi:hypothetical protein
MTRRQLARFRREFELLAASAPTPGGASGPDRPRAIPGPLAERISRRRVEIPADADPPPGWPPQVGRSAEPGDLTPKDRRS